MHRRQPLQLSLLVLLLLSSAFVAIAAGSSSSSSSNPQPFLRRRAAAAAASASAFLGARIGRQRHHRLATAFAGVSPPPRRMATTTLGASGNDAEDPWVFDVLFTGTGQSSSVPLLKHIVEPGKCETCHDALTRPGSKNKCVYFEWAGFDRIPPPSID